MNGKGAAPCLNCGFCCRQAPCGWGERTSTKDRTCRHLIADPSRPGRWLCGIYDQIVGQPTSEVSPAFGTGCCSTMNSFRKAILEEGPFIILKRWVGQPATVQPASEEKFSTRVAAEARVAELRPDFPGREFCVVPTRP